MGDAEQAEQDQEEDAGQREVKETHFVKLNYDTEGETWNKVEN